MICLRSSPLGSHMTSTVDCNKCKAVIFLDVSSNLTVKFEWSPWCLNFPSDFLQPLLSSISWNSAISVSWVLEDLVFVLESLVDFERSISSRSVVKSTIAVIPYWCISWNVQLSSDCVVSEIVLNWLCVYTGWYKSKMTFLLILFVSSQEWCIFVWCHIVLEFRSYRLVMVFVGRVHFEFWRARWEALSKDIIYVNTCCINIVEFIHPCFALSWKSSSII